VTDATAFDYLTIGALFITMGAIVQAILSSLQAARNIDPLHGWVRVLAWGAVTAGSACTFAGAGHFSGWW
jgi:hypothetical protein